MRKTPGSPLNNVAYWCRCRLRVLNAAKNRLQMLPELNESVDLNKVQELYLTGNMLGDVSMQVISGYERLKVLHIAHNEIHNLYDRFLTSRCK